MKIFDSLQSSPPSGCENMSQYVNESDSTVQVSKDGDYLGPNKVVIAFDNSFIERGLRSNRLRKVDFDNDKSKLEPKQAKKTKKQESEEVVDVATEENILDEIESSYQEDSVVATEPTES